MDEVTTLAENNVATTAEETTTEETAAAETTGAADMAQTEETPSAEEAPAGESAEAAPQAEQVEAASDGEATSENADAQSDAGSTPAAPTRDADGFSNALPTLEGEDAPRKHVAGGIGYEIIYVVRSGDQKLVEQTGNRVRDLIEKNEGAIDNVRASEVRRFAYPIKKQTEGVYVVVNARFKPEVTNEMDRFFKLEENVLRHMMLKEDN